MTILEHSDYLITIFTTKNPINKSQLHCDTWRLFETLLIRKYSRLVWGEISEVLPLNSLPKVNPMKMGFS